MDKLREREGQIVFPPLVIPIFMQSRVKRLHQRAGVGIRLLDHFVVQRHIGHTASVFLVVFNGSNILLIMDAGQDAHMDTGVYTEQTG